MGMAQQKPKVITEFEHLITLAVTKGESSTQLALEGMKLLAWQLQDLNQGISDLIKKIEPPEEKDD